MLEDRLPRPRIHPVRGRKPAQHPRQFTFVQSRTADGALQTIAALRQSLWRIAELQGWSEEVKKYAIFSWIPQSATTLPLKGEGNMVRV